MKRINLGWNLCQDLAVKRFGLIQAACAMMGNGSRENLAWIRNGGRHIYRRKSENRSVRNTFSRVPEMQIVSDEAAWTTL